MKYLWLTEHQLTQQKCAVCESTAILFSRSKIQKLQCNNKRNIWHTVKQNKTELI